MLAWGSGKRFKSPSWKLSFVFLAFILGVAIHSWMPEPLPIEPVLVAGIFAVMIGATFLSRSWSLFCFCAAALLFGLGRYAVSFPVEGPSSIASLANREVRIEGTIVSDPERVDDRQKFTLTDLSANGQPYANDVLAWLPSYPERAYGEIVSFRCHLEEPEPFDGFAYDRYLLRVGIVATCRGYEEPMVIAADGGNDLRRSLIGVRSAFEDRLEVALPEPHASLASGLLLGIQELPDDLSESFRRTGTSHIVAASGYNVGLVLAMLMGGLAMFLKRQKAFWFLLVGVLLYVLLAGAEAAVLRAGIMGATVLLARQTGRATSPRNILLLAVVVMLVGNPRLLRDDVGFQLSMLATIGLLVLAPYFGKRFSFLPESFGIREALASTCAATIFTLPIVLWNFGAPSLVAPIANLLVLPLVPYAMVVATVSAALTFIDPTLGQLVGGFAWAFEEAIIRIVTVLAAV